MVPDHRTLVIIQPVNMGVCIKWLTPLLWDKLCTYVHAGINGVLWSHLGISARRVKNLPPLKNEKVTAKTTIR